MSDSRQYPQKTLYIDITLPGGDVHQASYQYQDDGRGDRQSVSIAMSPSLLQAQLADIQRDPDSEGYDVNNLSEWLLMAIGEGLDEESVLHDDTTLARKYTIKNPEDMGSTMVQVYAFAHQDTFFAQTAPDGTLDVYPLITQDSGLNCVFTQDPLVADIIAQRFPSLSLRTIDVEALDVPESFLQQTERKLGASLLSAALLSSRITHQFASDTPTADMLSSVLAQLPEISQAEQKMLTFNAAQCKAPAAWIRRAELVSEPSWAMRIRDAHLQREAFTRPVVISRDALNAHLPLVELQPNSQLIEQTTPEDNTTLIFHRHTPFQGTEQTDLIGAYRAEADGRLALYTDLNTLTLLREQQRAPSATHRPAATEPAQHIHHGRGR